MRHRDDATSPFELPERRLPTKTLTFIAMSAALGVLATVLLVAVYAFNVGTIWSSQKQPVRAVRSPAVTPSPSRGAPAAVGVRNASAFDIALVLRDRRGREAQIGSVLRGRATRVPLPAGADCLDGVLIAQTAAGEIERSPLDLCAGQTWTIDGR